MKITKSLLTKLEDIFAALEFKVRYEKGSFQSGYCLLEQQQVIVINKFFPLEGKINVLTGILRKLDSIEESLLTPAQRKLVIQLRQKEIEF